MENEKPWVPVTDPVLIKHLGKLTEELGELTSSVARCLIQGVDALHPVTGKPNRQWLQEEITDVMVGMQLLDELIKFEDNPALNERFDTKIERLRAWHYDLAGSESNPIQIKSSADNPYVTGLYNDRPYLWLMDEKGKKIKRYRSYEDYVG